MSPEESAEYEKLYYSEPPEDPYAEPEPPKVRFKSASKFRMKGVKWLMQGRIPAGMITLLAGREGIGKSTVALDVAAQLTRGELEGRYFGKPQNVILCATEDSWEHTIIPRLKAVKADMARVIYMEIQEGAGWRSFQAQSDVALIRKEFELVKPALMVIDPLMSVLGKADTHKQAEVQMALEPLIKLCGDQDMAVLALIHVNKSGTTDPLNSIMGSKAFTTIPRSILYCIEEADGRKSMCHTKCNVGPKLATIEYSIRAVTFELPEEEVDEGDSRLIHTSAITWGEEDERSAQDILVESSEAQAPKSDNAKAILEMVESCGEAGIARKDLASMLPHIKGGTLDSCLTRLKKRGQLGQNDHEMYVIPDKSGKKVATAVQEPAF